MPFRRSLAAALLYALLPTHAIAQDAAATATIGWVLPWETGTTLEYASEDLTVSDLVERERTRSTAIATVRIVEAGEQGFVQSWSWQDSAFVVEEGDKAREAATREFNARMQDLPLEVELDAAGNYVRVHDLARVTPRLRKLTRPLVLANLEARLAQVPDAELRAQARRAATAQVEQFLDRMLEPQRLEALLARNIQWYNAFTGIDVEPGQDYTVRTLLPNPDGGAPIPADLTFSLSAFEDDSEDLYVVFRQQFDPQFGDAAAKAIVEGLLGTALEQGPDAPDIVIADEGMFAVHRASGVVEMFEATRTVKFGDRSRVERHRLRLLNGEHSHAWRDDAEGLGAGAH
jgi:hypothetical protein